MCFDLDLLNYMRMGIPYFHSFVSSFQQMRLVIEFLSYPKSCCFLFGKWPMKTIKMISGSLSIIFYFIPNLLFVLKTHFIFRAHSFNLYFRGY